MTELLSAATVIDRFEGRFGFLSNFHRGALTVHGRTYLSAEHAFNAAKATTPAQHDWVAHAPTPGEAKSRGRRVTLREGWDSVVRYQVMDDVLAAKFTDPQLREALLATGDALLVEGTEWHDLHWGGFCLCERHRTTVGLNHLGRALMRLRRRLADVPDTSWVRVAVTGHRPHLLSAQQTEFAREQVDRLAIKLRDEHGAQVALTGAALGADMLWADAARAAGLATWVYRPGPDQAARWDESDQKRWEELLASSTRVVTAADRTNGPSCHARNELLIRDSDVMIAVSRPSLTTGGTAATVAKARAAGRTLITVDVEAQAVRVAAGHP